MIKSCRNCKYCYSKDESDVSGLDCMQHKLIKIVDSTEKHLMCNGEFKFSLLNFLLNL